MVDRFWPGKWGGDVIISPNYKELKDVVARVYERQMEAQQQRQQQLQQQQQSSEEEKQGGYDSGNPEVTRSKENISLETVNSSYYDSFNYAVVPEEIC